MTSSAYEQAWYSERRTRPRCAIQGAQALVAAQDGSGGRYQVENLSSSGVLLTGGPQLPIGSRVSLCLYLPGQPGVYLEGVIRRAREHRVSGYGIAFKDVDPEAEDTIHNALLGVLEAQYRLSGPRLLIVDDCPEVSRSLKRDLSWYPGTIELARTAAQALSIVADPDRRLDLAIVDLYLGEEDGLALMDTLRAQRPTLQCILMSGAVRRAQLTLAALNGRADGVLPKPWTQSALRALVAAPSAHSREMM